MIGRRTTFIGLAIPALLVAGSGGMAETLKVVETMPANDGTLSGPGDDYFVRFDQPVDHLHSMIDILQNGKVMETLHPRFKTEPNVLFARAPTLAAGQIHHALVGPGSGRRDRVPGGGFVLGRERPALVGGEQRLRGSLFAGDGLVDPLAHLGGAAAALGALAASPENVDRTTGAGPDGGVDFSFPDGPADAKIHVPLTLPLCSCDLLAEEVKTRSQYSQGPVQAGEKPFKRYFSRASRKAGSIGWGALPLSRTTVISAAAMQRSSLKAAEATVIELVPILSTPVPSSTFPGQCDSARNDTVMPAEMPRKPSSRGAIMPMSRMKVRRAVSM